VSELNRREIDGRLTNRATIDAHIFDEAQKDVEDLIRSSVYVNFLNSDVYLSYIQVKRENSLVFYHHSQISIFSLCKMASRIHHVAAGVMEEVQTSPPNLPSPLISPERAHQMIEDLTRKGHYLLCMKILNSLIPQLSSTSQSH
jgi:hypothetical protein